MALLYLAFLIPSFQSCTEQPKIHYSASRSMNRVNPYLDKEPNTVESSFLIGFHFFVLFSSLGGDVTILIATFTDGAFRLNELIVAIIQHIAVNDLMLCVLSVLPATVNIIAVVGWDHWILNQDICVLRLKCMYYILPVSMYLVAILTTTKLVILKWPLRAKQWTKKRAHLLCVVIWLIKMWMPIYLTLTDNGNSRPGKDRSVYDCDILEFAVDSSRIFILETTLNMLLPISIVFLTTIPTLCILFQGRKVSKRSRGRKRWQGIVTVVLTASVYILSLVPVAVIAYLNLKSVHFHRLAWYLPLINIVLNFYIYCLAIPHFRRFLLEKIQLLKTFLPQPSQQQTIEMDIVVNRGAQVQETQCTQ